MGIFELKREGLEAAQNFNHYANRANNKHLLKKKMKQKETMKMFCLLFLFLHQRLSFSLPGCFNDPAPKPPADNSLNITTCEMQQTSPE